MAQRCRGCLYVATAAAGHAEMAERIRRHRKAREWETLQVPRDLRAASAAARGCLVLIDCLTLWLSNQLLAGGNPDAATDTLIHDISQARAPVLCVSNDVGWAVVPENPLARPFRDFQGRLNQRIAAEACLVMAAMAGLPTPSEGPSAGVTHHLR